MIPTAIENSKSRAKSTEELFMSFNFWLTNKEIKQLELLTVEHEIQPAIIVQKILKHALKQLREKNIERMNNPERNTERHFDRVASMARSS